MAAHDQIERTIFTVATFEDGWAVEHAGKYFDRSRDKAEVTASANKRARELLLAGTPVQVRIEGETGYF